MGGVSKAITHAVKQVVKPVKHAVDEGVKFVKKHPLETAVMAAGGYYLASSAGLFGASTASGSAVAGASTAGATSAVSGSTLLKAATLGVGSASLLQSGGRVQVPTQPQLTQPQMTNVTTPRLPSSSSKNIPTVNSQFNFLGDDYLFGLDKTKKRFKGGVALGGMSLLSNISSLLGDINV